jgi:hypothetical protein
MALPATAKSRRKEPWKLNKVTRAPDRTRLQTPTSGTAAQQLKSLRQSATYKLGRRLVV